MEMQTITQKLNYGGLFDVEITFRFRPDGKKATVILSAQGITREWTIFRRTVQLFPILHKFGLYRFIKDADKKFWEHLSYELDGDDDQTEED